MTTTMDTHVPDSRELALRIAPHLAALTGGRWTEEGENDRHSARLRLAGADRAPYTSAHDGAVLWICVDSRGRAECAGVFPRMPGGRTYSAEREEHGRIAFDARRDARLLARDIARRCLTGYLGAYVKACAYARETVEAHAQAKLVARHLATAFGTGEPRTSDHDGHARVWLADDVKGAHWLEVRPGWGDKPSPTVHVELSDLSPDKAAAVLHVLRGTHG